MYCLLTDFSAIWDNIVQCEGQTFATTTGQAFAYDVQEAGLAVRRSDLFLRREDLERLYRSGSTNGGGKGQIAAYCNAVLRDNRIRG